MHVLLLLQQVLYLCFAYVESDWFSVIFVRLRILNQILFHRVILIFFTVIVRPKKLINAHVLMEIGLRKSKIAFTVLNAVIVSI